MVTKAPVTLDAKRPCGMGTPLPRCAEHPLPFWPFLTMLWDALRVAQVYITTSLQTADAVLALRAKVKHNAELRASAREVRSGRRGWVLRLQGTTLRLTTQNCLVSSTSSRAFVPL